MDASCGGGVVALIRAIAKMDADDGNSRWERLTSILLTKMLRPRDDSNDDKRLFNDG